MGEEISSDSFDKAAYSRFHTRLSRETYLLDQWFASGRFSDLTAMGGFEQEAWMVNPDFSPAPRNEQFIELADSGLVSAELAKFNIELNVHPRQLQGTCLRHFHNDLADNWKACNEIAGKTGSKLVMIGILPTVRDDDLTTENMSGLNRYKALNEQVMLARKGIPMHLEIKGKEYLQSVHYDVMLESAATSFQIHRQVPVDAAPRYYNAAIILSALSVAVGCNSPYLFGRKLWEETRIPLFEQAVEVGGLGKADQGPIRRVTFGNGYVRRHIFECFRENLEHYPVLLPVDLEQPEESLPHLRLHNGTIWRWNRPLIGFDDEGTPHVRIEHRVVSAGPTITDEIANTAFFYGLLEWMANQSLPYEYRIEHAQAKYNFYEGARLGLEAGIKWVDGTHVQIANLVSDALLVKAREGLERLDIDRNDIKDYLEIIELRVKNRKTGAAWQLSFIETHGPDFSSMLEAYYANQQSGKPVHEWPV